MLNFLKDRLSIGDGDASSGPKSSGSDTDERESVRKRQREANERELIERVNAYQPERFKLFKEAAIEDVLDYRFSCERFGNHLAMFIERGGDRQIIAQAVDGVSAVLIIGAPPDLDGEAQICADWDSLVWCKMPITRKSLAAWTEEYPRGYYREESVQVPADAKFGGGVNYLSKIGGVARPACDDVIRFGNQGYNLAVPFGLGRDVFNTILLALRADEQRHTLSVATREAATRILCG